jgi:hypothetical protein
MLKTCIANYGFIARLLIVYTSDVCCRCVYACWRSAGSVDGVSSYGCIVGVSRVSPATSQNVCTVHEEKCFQSFHEV